MPMIDARVRAALVIVAVVAAAAALWFSFVPRSPVLPNAGDRVCVGLHLGSSHPEICAPVL